MIFQGCCFQQDHCKVDDVAIYLHKFTMTLMEVAGAKEFSKNNMITFSSLP